MEVDVDDSTWPELATFESVYRSELGALVRLATFLVGDQAMAEELVQEAFLSLHQRWDDVDNPGAYVRTASVNRCRDAMRRRVRSDRHLVIERATAAGPQPEPHYLVDALQTLSPLRRSVVVLRYYGGYKLTEIGDLLDIPEGTVRSNLHRGLDQLREVLPR